MVYNKHNCTLQLANNNWPLEITSLFYSDTLHKASFKAYFTFPNCRPATPKHNVATKMTINPTRVDAPKSFHSK